MLLISKILLLLIFLIIGVMVAYKFYYNAVEVFIGYKQQKEYVAAYRAQYEAKLKRLEEFKATHQNFSTFENYHSMVASAHWAKKDLLAKQIDVAEYWSDHIRDIGIPLCCLLLICILVTEFIVIAFK